MKNRLLKYSFAATTALMAFAPLAYADNMIVTTPGSGQITVTLAAPERTGDLSIPFYQANSVTLNWQLPSAQADTGAVYDIRYSTSLITDANFANATQFTGAVIPSLMLSMKNDINRSEIVSGLAQNTTYYFALKEKFDGSPWSELSDVPSMLIPLKTPNTGIIPLTNMSTGKSGGDVGLLQKFLASTGFYTGPINSQFGVALKAAVVSFQKKNGLPATGTYGPMTRKVMQGMVLKV